MRDPAARGRLRQVERWLAVHYPCDRPVRVRVSNVGPHAAETQRVGREYRILIGREALKLWGAELVEVLIHEWAHARVWRTHRENDVTSYHDAEWAIEYGAIYQRFYDAGGNEESREFSSYPRRG